MDSETLEDYLDQGEGIDVEFKESQTELNESAFESICAFLNRNGGHLFLGVTDDHEVQGVHENCVQDIKNSIVNNANNPQKLSPPFYLSPEVIGYEDKEVIHTYVPESSQVHRTAGEIYDRNEDGDLDITNQPEQVTRLYKRKQSTYTENEIYPYIEMDDFKKELFDRIRKLARSERANHPWLEMDDRELLRSAGLYREDKQSNKEGYTLAAVLLLGKDEVIRDVLPHHRTDAIKRVQNKDRYDDRDDIRTNLIESYDRLMSFVQKHLPDKYYNEGEQRISVRDLIFHEIIGNMLIHREYTNPYPAKLIIEEDRVVTENANRTRNAGEINPDNFSPYPKNPVIASFFKEIGRADELGSGVRNTFKYCEIYTPGATPKLVEDDIFETVIPLDTEEESENGAEKSSTGTPQEFHQDVSVELKDTHYEILEMCQTPKKRSDLMDELDFSSRPTFTKNYLSPLLDEDLLEMTLPDKPESKNQKYVTTEKGEDILVKHFQDT